jgi:hypothetical protein
LAGGDAIAADPKVITPDIFMGFHSVPIPDGTAIRMRLKER